MEDPLGKNKQQDNPFIEPSQQHAVVDMKGSFKLKEKKKTILSLCKSFKKILD